MELSGVKSKQRFLGLAGVQFLNYGRHVDVFKTEFNFKNQNRVLKRKLKY